MSSHIFFTFTLVFPGVYVFVSVNPPAILPVVNDLYPDGTPLSSTVYVISVSFSYFGKFVNVYVHSFPFPSSVCLCFSVPFAFNISSIDVGLIPS